jgi:Na+-driven multidrug efflux pump
LKEESNLSYKEIFLFWTPLLATWLMMSLEGPFLTALIARLAEPEYNLASYGVAFSIALIVESPVIMMLSAATALVESKNTFLRLRNFVYSINFALVLVMLVLIFPPVFNFFSIQVLNLPLKVSELTHIAIVILIPWAPSIGYRRFYQGILIRNNLTKMVALGTIVRLLGMSFTAIIFFVATEVHGVIVGASALSVGVISEAIATRLMSYKIVKRIISSEDSGAEISYKEIFSFYYPLVLTSFIALGIHPIVTFFIGQSRMALESLAVLPVLNSLVFIFRAFGLSYQEVGVALIKTSEDFIKLRNFAYGIAFFVFIGLSLISFSPFSEIWLTKVSGLSKELSEFAKTPLIIYTFFPLTTVWINFQRSLLVSVRKTKPITYATLIEVTGVVLILMITIKYFDLIGVTAAVVAYLIGRIAADFYLIIPFVKARQKLFKSSGMN